VSHRPTCALFVAKNVHSQVAIDTVAGHPFALEQHFHDGGGQSHFNFLAHQLVGHAVVCFCRTIVAESW
jgi:hypothetical protein